MTFPKEMIDITSSIWKKIQIYKSLLNFQTGNSPGRKCFLVKALLTLVGFLLLLEKVSACQISEFYCDNGKCVSLDKFCNSINECGDGSDEPRHCSPCNRTFYGEVGGTYTIAVHRPSSRESQLPYVCQLTFAAGGSKFGDLVQLIFNSVTLGPSPDQDRYPSSKPPTCREGHVALNEPDRPTTAGHWCGHDWGQAVFFSETSRVTLTLSLFPVSASPGTFAFDFRLTYKFLRKVDSSVRYGPPAQPYFRGQLLPGTFCSLIYNSCDKMHCALQTPNFPGIYPRNITCFYAIRQLNAPVGHRAVIQLGQEKDHMVFVRNRAVSKKNSYVPGEPGGGGLGLGLGMGGGGGESGGSGKRGSGSGIDELTIGEDCDSSSDHVTIYDGYTIRDPVLLKFCGGGKFPTITSSGNELLMEFYSAPTDYLLQSAVYTAIQGFHVDVEIKHLPVGSHTYVENHNCFFTVSSFQQKRGFLTSPQHSLPSRTTCTYLLQGLAGEIVWISLLKFYIGKEYGGGGDDGGGGGGSGPASAGLTGSSYLRSGAAGGSLEDQAPANYMAAMSSSLECNSTYFQIWQGIYSEKSNNSTLLAHLCEDTPIKRTCEFMLSSTTSSKPPPRACHPEESFISKGPNLSLKLKIDTTTVLRPAEFKLYYEFVDTRQDGEPFYHPHLLLGQRQTRPNLPKTLRSELNLGDKFEGDYSPKDSTRFELASCSRLFKSQNRAIQAGSFTSPRNVFYFGRGGVTNLTCIYRFQGGKNERVKLTFNKISLAGGYCKAEIHPDSGRSMCHPREEVSTTGKSGRKKVTEGTLQLWEVPWTGNDSRIMKECLCEAATTPLTYISVSNTMDIVLMVKNMQPFHDQNHFIFEGRYEFIKHPDCTRTQKLKSAGGTFTLKQPEKSPYQSCSHYPWEIQPQTPSHYIFLTIPGRTLRKYPFNSSPSPEPCTTRNRILIYSGGFSGHLLQIICPEDTFSLTSPSSTVSIFSSGWENLQEYPNFVENPHLSIANLPSNSQLIIELVSKGPGSNAMYDIKYMQISRRDEPLDWNYFLAPSSPSGSGGVMSGGGNLIGIDGGHKMTGGSVGGIPSSGGSGSSPDTSSSSIVSSPPVNDQLEDDVCFRYKCPELNACISPTLFCDGVSNCPSGYDEEECEFFPIPKTYLVLAAASLTTFLVLSCCFGCLLCKKRRAERRDKLLMSSTSRTPTEEFFGTGTGSMSMTSGGGGGGRGAGPESIGHHHYHHHQREIVC